MNKSAIIHIVERQFLPCLQMLEKIIQDCPNDLWLGRAEGIPLWRRVLHTLESIDFWFVDLDEYYFDALGKDVSAELTAPCTDTLSKEETLEYFQKIEGKCRRFFAGLDDIGLLRNSARNSGLTLLDVIISQIRHIQLNIGYCNEALRAAGATSVAWIGFGE